MGGQQARRGEDTVVQGAQGGGAQGGQGAPDQGGGGGGQAAPPQLRALRQRAHPVDAPPALVVPQVVGRRQHPLPQGRFALL